MGFLGWGVAVLAYNAVIAYALSRGRAVKTGLKIPFATFFFESSEREAERQSDSELMRRVSK